MQRSGVQRNGVEWNAAVNIGQEEAEEGVGSIVDITYTARVTCHAHPSTRIQARALTVTIKHKHTVAATAVRKMCAVRNRCVSRGNTVVLTMTLAACRRRLAAAARQMRSERTRAMQRPHEGWRWSRPPPLRARALQQQ